MMELRPVGVGGVLAVLGNAIRSETAVWKKPSPPTPRCSSNTIRF